MYIIINGYIYEFVIKKMKGLRRVLHLDIEWLPHHNTTPVGVLNSYHNHCVSCKYQMTLFSPAVLLPTSRRGCCCGNTKIHLTVDIPVPFPLLCVTEDSKC